ncbi:MAG: MATE family efflux transporter, partial [Actinomycetota bacterium]
MARQAGLRALDKRILALAVPALGTLAADPLLSLADTAFVAQLGTVPLAALGVDTALFSFAFFAFNFLAYATTPMVARRLGAGDRPGAGRVVTQAMFLALVLGTASMAVLAGAADILVSLMQAPPDVTEPASAYLRIRAVAAPAMLVVTAGHGAFRGLQDTRTPLAITLGVNLLNLALDPLLIFGLGWGLEGAATATVVAQWSGAACFAWLLVRRGSQMGWSWLRPRLRELGPMLTTGGIITLRTLFLTGTLTAATAVAASVGAAEVAAHQVLAQTWLLLAMTVDALAIAAQALVADELGRANRRAAGEVAARLGRWGLGAGMALMGVVLAGRFPLAAVFGSDPGVASLIQGVAILTALMQPLAALVFVADGVYLGLLQVRYLLYSTAAGAVGAGAVFTLTLVEGWGLWGVWWGVTAMVGARLTVLAAAYRGALARA